MRIETASEPGSPDVPNEDFVSVAVPAGGAGGALVLLDGVTPPPDNGGCVHSVPWFTARLGGTLLELAVRREEPLAQCLSEAVARTARAHEDTCDLSRRLTPQATVVAARWDASAVEYLVLSDSALLLAAPDGAVTPVLDDRIDRLRAARGVRLAPLRNQEGGFFTAAADPAVAARAVTGTVPRERVRALAALTDGAARSVEVYGADDWAGVFALLGASGPGALITRVRTLEAEQQPPGKPHDDATAVLAEL